MASVPLDQIRSCTLTRPLPLNWGGVFGRLRPRPILPPTPALAPWFWYPPGGSPDLTNPKTNNNDPSSANLFPHLVSLDIALPGGFFASLTRAATPRFPLSICIRMAFCPTLCHVTAAVHTISMQLTKCLLACQQHPGNARLNLVSRSPRDVDFFFFSLSTFR